MRGKKKTLLYFYTNNKQLINKIIFLLLSMLAIHSTLEHQSSNYNTSVCLSLLVFWKLSYQLECNIFKKFTFTNVKVMWIFYNICKTQVLRGKKV